MKTNCQHCEGKGVMYVPNSFDDFDKEYCYCLAGKNLEMRHEISKLAKQKTYA